MSAAEQMPLGLSLPQDKPSRPVPSRPPGVNPRGPPLPVPTGPRGVPGPAARLQSAACCTETRGGSRELRGRDPPSASGVTGLCPSRSRCRGYGAGGSAQQGARRSPAGGERHVAARDRALLSSV